jgi:hypothetical protein
MGAMGLPFLDLLIGLIDRDAISLLHDTLKLLDVTSHCQKIVICQSTPLGFRGANKLLELALDGISVHKSLLLLVLQLETL